MSHAHSTDQVVIDAEAAVAVAFQNQGFEELTEEEQAALHLEVEEGMNAFLNGDYDNDGDVAVSGNAVVVPPNPQKPGAAERVRAIQKSESARAKRGIKRKTQAQACASFLLKEHAKSSTLLKKPTATFLKHFLLENASKDPKGYKARAKSVIALAKAIQNRLALKR
jgi:hypothetical protein